MKTTARGIREVIADGWGHDSPLHDKIRAIDYPAALRRLADLGYTDESDVRWAAYELLADRLDYEQPEILRIQLLLLLSL